MPKPFVLMDVDAHAALRALASIRDLADRPAARARFLVAVGDLIDASVGAAGTLTRDAGETAALAIECALSCGAPRGPGAWSADADVARALARDDAARLLDAALARTGPHDAVLRAEALPGVVWRGSSVARDLAGRGVDEALVVSALSPARPRRRFGFAFFRAGPFTDRDAALALLVHAHAAAWLWQDPSMAPGADMVVEDLPPTVGARLSPTEQAVAPLLARGLTEAQIAKRLGRSHHTIHDHVKAIYAKLGTRSRLELGLLLRNGDSENAGGAPPADARPASDADEHDGARHADRAAAGSAAPPTPATPPIPPAPSRAPATTLATPMVAARNGRASPLHRAPASRPG